MSKAPPPGFQRIAQTQSTACATDLQGPIPLNAEGQGTLQAQGRVKRAPVPSKPRDGSLAPTSIGGIKAPFKLYFNAIVKPIIAVHSDIQKAVDNQQVISPFDRTDLSRKFLGDQEIRERALLIHLGK